MTLSDASPGETSGTCLLLVPATGSRDNSDDTPGADQGAPADTSTGEPEPRFGPPVHSDRRGDAGRTSLSHGLQVQLIAAAATAAVAIWVIARRRCRRHRAANRSAVLSTRREAAPLSSQGGPVRVSIGSSLSNRTCGRGFRCGPSRSTRHPGCRRGTARECTGRARVSFTDESLGKYYSTLATQDDGPTTVLVTGLIDDTRETIIIGVEGCELIALERLGDDLALLAASDVLKETFELAKAMGTFTATTIAERLRISPPMRITAINASSLLERSSDAAGSPSAGERVCVLRTRSLSTISSWP